MLSLQLLLLLLLLLSLLPLLLLLLPLLLLLSLLLFQLPLLPLQSNPPADLSDLGDVEVVHDVCQSVVPLNRLAITDEGRGKGARALPPSQ